MGTDYWSVDSSLRKLDKSWAATKIYSASEEFCKTVKLLETFKGKYSSGA